MYKRQGAANIREENQRARLERVFDDGMVGDARDEAERAFRADHQVTEDVERVFVIDQRVQAVAGGVLDLELVADALGEPCICARVAAEAVDFAEQRAVALLEGGYAGGVFAVEHGARADKGAVAETIDDASITSQVKYALMSHKSTSALKTKVSTKDGIVVLSGVARNEAEKSLAGKLASSIRGVKSVTNEMTIRS